MKKVLIHNIKYLYTNNNKPPVKGTLMKDLTVYSNAYIYIDDGIIKAIGEGDYSAFQDIDVFNYDASQAICIPGLIDSHTHLVHGGSREYEFAMKISGVDYLEILKNGGGILSTVNATEKAAFSELYDQAYNSLNEMLLFGVTSLEAKSGYGLLLDTELKALKVTQELNKNHVIDIYSTYLGAHALPVEYKSKREDFIQIILNDLEIVKKANLAVYADVFCETGVFSAEETRLILEKAKKLGFKLRLHSDEIDSIGGTDVGLELQAKTIDHLMAITDQDIEKMAKTDTIANLLPSTSFFLGKEFAPARKMIDSGVAVSVSSDYNPGSTPSENYQLTLQIAGNKLRMLPEEVLTAATINPAYSLDIHDRVGSLQVGKEADILLLKSKNLDYFIYHYGINHTKAVFKKGKLVVENRMILKELEK